MPLKNLSIRRLAAPFWGKRGRVTAAFQQDRTGVCVRLCPWTCTCVCMIFCAVLCSEGRYVAVDMLEGSNVRQ